MKSLSMKERQRLVSEGMRLSWARRKQEIEAQAIRKQEMEAQALEFHAWAEKQLEDLRQFEAASRKVRIICDE